MARALGGARLPRVPLINEEMVLPPLLLDVRDGGAVIGT